MSLMVTMKFNGVLSASTFLRIDTAFGFLL
jgi:hypothetical protein